MDVVIVGGGTAGLTAGYVLKQAGVDFLILEEKELAGGRVIGMPKDGYILDLGAQFFFKFYRSTFQLCEQLGIGDQVVPFPFRVAMWRQGRAYPLIASLDPRILWKNRRDLVKFRGLSPRASLQMARFLPFLLRRRRDLDFIDYEGILDLDEISLAELARTLSAEELLEELFQPLASCLTLGEPEDIGAGYGLALLWYCFFGLWTLKRGIGTLAQRLYQENQERIKLGSPASRIVVEGGKVKGVESGGDFIPASRVICATTATKALKLMPQLPDEFRLPLEKASYSACCHVILGLYNQALPSGWWALAASRRYGLCVAGITDNSIKSPYYSPTKTGLVHCFTYGKYARELNGLPHDQVLKRLMQDLWTLLPSLQREPRFSEIYRWDEAVCLAPPGHLANMARLRRENYRAVKGLYLAGEYLYMPSVEGAVHSGMEAAQALLAE